MPPQERPFRPNDPPTAPAPKPNDPRREVTREAAIDVLRRAGEEQERTLLADGYRQLGRLRQLKKEIAADLYEMAEILRDFHDRDLWKKMDLKSETGDPMKQFTSFEDFSKREAGISYSLAMELIAVVEAFPRETAIQEGMQRCYALITLARATPEEDHPRELERMVPSLANLTARELEERARRIRLGIETVDGRPTDAAKLAAEVAAELEKLLRLRGAEGAAVVAEIKDGEWWLSARFRAMHVRALRAETK